MPIRLDGDVFYTIAEAAEKTGYCRDHIRRQCVAGKLEATCRGTWFITEASLKKWLIADRHAQDEK